MSEQLQETFDRAVEEGEYRINRGWQSLLATGAVGGLDVAMGVLAPSLAAAWAALGNMIGGVGLVTVLRLFQVTGEDSDSPNRGRARGRRRSRR